MPPRYDALHFGLFDFEGLHGHIVAEISVISLRSIPAFVFRNLPIAALLSHSRNILLDTFRAPLTMMSDVDSASDTN